MVLHIAKHDRDTWVEAKHGIAKGRYDTPMVPGFHDRTVADQRRVGVMHRGKIEKIGTIDHLSLKVDGDLTRRHEPEPCLSRGARDATCLEERHRLSLTDRSKGLVDPIGRIDGEKISEGTARYAATAS